MNLHRVIGRAAIGWSAAAIALSAAAQGVASPERERARIVAERAAAEARYAEKQRDCAGRFVVSSCVEDAKRERRETLTRLKQEQNRLDDDVRKQRAAERAEAIRQRSDEDAQRARAAAERPAHEHSTPEPFDRPSTPKPATDGASSPSPGAAHASRDPAGHSSLHAPAHAERPGEATRHEQEARSRATFDAAQRAAEAHKAEVEARNAQRTATKKPSRPLPVPDAASAP